MSSTILDNSSQSRVKYQSVQVGRMIDMLMTPWGQTASKKVKYTVKSTNNLEEMLATMKKRLSEKNTDSIILYDEEKKEIIFKDDQDILGYQQSKKKLYYRLVQEIQSQISEKTKRQKEHFSLKVESSPSEIKSQEIHIFKGQQPSSPKKEKKSSPLKKNQDKTQGVSITNMQSLIENILKKNLSDIAQVLFPQGQKSQPSSFKQTCSFCGKSPLCNRIFACEMNLKVVGCEECSQYLKYQLPFPIKIYTDPQLYKKQRSQQAETSSEKEFFSRLKSERSQRNEKIREAFSTLPNFDDL